MVVTRPASVRAWWVVRGVARLRGEGQVDAPLNYQKRSTQGRTAISFDHADLSWWIRSR